MEAYKAIEEKSELQEAFLKDWFDGFLCMYHFSPSDELDSENGLQKFPNGELCFTTDPDGRAAAYGDYRYQATLLNFLEIDSVEFRPQENGEIWVAVRANVAANRIQLQKVEDF